MTRTTLAAGIGAALLCGVGALAAQGKFEGMVAYRIVGGDGKAVVVRYYELGTRSRQEFEAQGQTGATISDAATSEMIVLLPQRKQYMTINLKAAGPMAQMAQGMAGGGRGGADLRNPPDLSQLKVTATGRHEVIAGVPCDVYVFSSPNASEHNNIEVCGAKGMGFLSHEATMLPSIAALLGSGKPELAALVHEGFFPLRVTMNEGDKRTLMEATALSRDKPNASLFAPPSDYAKLAMPGMMGGSR